MFVNLPLLYTMQYKYNTMQYIFIISLENFVYSGM